MRINVCVNGAFRYPQYIRWYAEAGVLGQFHYAHRRSDPAMLGLARQAVHNGWIKEYALQAAWRFLPGAALPRTDLLLGDAWQRSVIRRWRPSDTVEAVIGAVADKIVAHARAHGSKVLGHPVCAHPAAVAAQVGRAHRDLGLDPALAAPTAPDRRQAEIAGCDALLADSRVVARSFIAAGMPPERIAVVTPAVDTRRFRPRDEAERAGPVFRVVCVATVTPRKAQHVLLGAWRLLKLPRAELILVGPPGRHAGAVVRGYAGSFRHIGRLPNARLRDLLVTASAFVMPSVEDGFCQAVLEAMSCGVAPIVTAAVGAADLIRNGDNGFVVPPHDSDALAAALELLCREPDRAAALGEAAARTVGALGSWADYVGRVLAVHRSLLSDPAPLRRSA